MGVRLGGATARLPGRSTLATCVAPRSKPSSRSTAIGYGLKSLATHYGLAETRQQTFAELFGVHETAALDAHDDAAQFPAWAKYATNDAVLTYDLFLKLRDNLQSRPWCSQVHAERMRIRLQDPKLVTDIIKGRSKAEYDTGKTLWDLYEFYLLDFAEFLADLEERGVCMDRDILENIVGLAAEEEKKHFKKFVHCFEQIRTADGKLLNPDVGHMNISSASQLRHLLFGGSKNRSGPEHLDAQYDFAEKGSTKKTFQLHSIGLQPEDLRKNSTPLGWPKTSKDVVGALAGDPSQDRPGKAYEQLVNSGYTREDATRVSWGLHELSMCKQAKQMLTYFAEPLLGYLGSSSRIHPNWAFDTSTGRVTSRSPNMQNLPRASGDKYRLRSAVRATSGNTLVVADYSQLELRVLAHLTGCRSMIDKLKSGGDFHSEIAATMFPHVSAAVKSGSVVLQEVGTTGHKPVPTVKSAFPRERTQAKAINFGVAYGMEPATLAEDLSISTHDAEELLTKWLKDKPEITRWKAGVKEDLKINGETLSMLGRPRTFPLMSRKDGSFYRSKCERAGINFSVQGSAADIVMAAALRVWKDKQLADLGYEIILQIHDELVLEGPAQNAGEASRLVKELMENPFPEANLDFQFLVPLIVEVVVGLSLHDVKE